MESERKEDDFPGRVEAWNVGLDLAIRSWGRPTPQQVKALLPDLSPTRRRILRELCEAVIRDGHKILEKIGGSPKELSAIRSTWEQQFTTLYPWVDESNRDSIYSRCVYASR